MKKLILICLFCLSFFSACEEEETGFGTVIIHAQLDTGGAAAGVETYVVKGSLEERKNTDQNGNATYENFPAGSCDAGFFENSTYMFAAGTTGRKTIDVENDKTTEVELVVKRR